MMTGCVFAVNWGNMIVIAVILAILAVAGVSARKHFKGQGDCCGGGGGTVKAERKTLDQPEVQRWRMQIEGMHCENCKAAVERQINRIEGAACEVDLKEKTATVHCDRPIDPETLRRTVALMDYRVTGIDEIPTGSTENRKD